MSFGSITLAVTEGVVAMLEVEMVGGVFMRWGETEGGGGQDNCIMCHVAFLSIKFLVCCVWCNSSSSNWSHPSVLQSAFAAALCIETDS